MSLTFIVFLIVPILAPGIGQLVLLMWPWRTLFVMFSGFAVLVWIWAALRLPETLHPEYRLALDVNHVIGAAVRVLTDRTSLFYTLAIGVMFGSILGYVGMVQQIFDQVFHRPALMPAMFALCATTMGIASFYNSRMVERVGMRKISHVALLAYIGVTFTHSAVAYFGFDSLGMFVLMQAATMGCVGLAVGNFGAMAMEPMGAIAGIAASLQGFISTAGAAAVGALIGRSFNGSTLPLAGGAALCGLATLILVLVAERGRLMQPHHSAVL
jgi:MFS transporter, DHA1 family, multidrug resistance protein